MPRLFCWIVFALCALANQSAIATTHYWPNNFSTNCSGSLQACIDAAAAGDTVLLQILGAQTFGRYLAIDENITISRSLSLGTVADIDAVFAPGRNITVQLTGPSAQSISITDLTLQRGTIKIINDGGGAGTNISVQRVRINALPLNTGFACGIDVQILNGAVTPQISIGDNVLRASANAGDTGNGICVGAASDVAELNVSIFRNRVVGAVGAIDSGITVNQTGAGVTNITANTILGPRLSIGIFFVRTTGGAPQTVRIDNNVVVGQSDATEFAIEAGLSDGSVRVLNNTVAYGVNGISVGRFDFVSTISGRVSNNIVAFNSGMGYAVPNSSGINLINLENLTFANGSDSMNPGVGTINADPQFTSKSHPSLKPSSPAIDAGDLTEIPSGVLFDADGERRIVGAQVDMGAFERSSDQTGVLVAHNGNRSFNEVYIDHFAEPMTATDRPIVTPLRTNVLGAGQVQNLGVYQSSASPSGWSAFFQDSSQQMPEGRRFSIGNIVNGITALTHNTDVSSVSGALSRMDHPELNSRSFAIAVATPVWNGIYHNVPIGLQFISNRWAVRNEDGSSMPTGLGFHVAVAPFLSPNAARYGINTTGIGSPPIPFEWPLKHPLLDDTDCAAPMVGRVDDPDLAGTQLNPVPFALAYKAPSGPGAPGHWYVFSEQGSFLQGDAFNVMIDGHQANACRALASPLNDPSFRDGFE